MRDWTQVRRRGIVCAFAGCFLMAAFSGSAQAGVLQTVRERGHLVCGVSERMPGLSAVDKSGRWSGLEIDFCGAVSAAVFGTRDKVKFRPVTAGEGARALTAGDVDILLGGTVWTLSREADLGLRSAGVLFHDGQGLMVPRSFGVSSVLELSGASICVQKGTAAAVAVGAYFDARKMRIQLALFDTWADAVKAYAEGTCTLLTGDLPSLADERSRFAAPEDHLLMPELVAHEPTGPFVRQGDDPWLTLVHWTLLALIEAEQIAVTQSAVVTGDIDADARVQRFLGKGTALGGNLGLAPNWTERVIAEVGNYGEIYNRTLGEGSRLKLPRGANALWTNGGLMAAPVFR